MSKTINDMYTKIGSEWRYFNLLDDTQIKIVYNLLFSMPLFVSLHLKSMGRPPNCTLCWLSLLGDDDFHCIMWTVVDVLWLNMKILNKD